MQNLNSVPDSWWRVACERQHHPLACVSEPGYFTWCNEAWERLLGYSQRELEQRTWMSITVNEDIGGDQASASDLIVGSLSRYSLAKRYIHKMGHIVPVELSVYRFPPNVGPFECFVVEAIPESVPMVEFIRSRAETYAQIKALVSRLDLVESIQVTDHQNVESRNTINVGNNDPKWIAAVVIVLLIVAGIIYYEFIR